MNRAQKKKVQEIANFIVNNITLAEVTTLVIERSTEYAELIVKHNLDPKNFNSEYSRRKLHKKLKEFKFGKRRKQARPQVEENPVIQSVKDQADEKNKPTQNENKRNETSLFGKILKWLGIEEKRSKLPTAEKPTKKSRSKFSTKK